MPWLSKLIKEITPFNMVSKNLILTALYWINTRGLRFTAEWNSGERCTAYRQGKRFEWRVVRYRTLMPMQHAKGRKLKEGGKDWFLVCRTTRSSACSQSCEKRLLASSCLSVCPHRTTRLSLNGFSWNLIFEYFSKISRENSSFIKVWHQ
jgi:hypothetical protein